MKDFKETLRSWRIVCFWMALVIGGVGLDAAKAGQVVTWGYNFSNPTNAITSLTNVVSIAAGDNYALTLLSDGTVKEWDSDGSSQASVPSGLSNVIAVAAGGYTRLALKSDGTVVSWGDSRFNLPYNIPSGLSNVTALAAGNNHFLALKSDGTVIAWVAWGSNSYGQTNVPFGLSNVISIAAGGDNSLALKADGTMVGWGYVKPPNIYSNLVAIAAGRDFGVALGVDNVLGAWGNNNYGQTTVPNDVTNAIAIASGDYHSLLLLADATVRAFGNVTTNVGYGVTNVAAISAKGNVSMALVSAEAPVVILQPQSRSTFNGNDVSFRTTAMSAPPVSYQWMMNGFPIDGATNSTFSLTNVQFSDAGQYAVAVSGLYGSTVSSNATLVVNSSAPIILSQTGSSNVCQGSNVVCSVSVMGSQPFAYQWKLSGNDISGATQSSLLLTNLQPGNQDQYLVVITNAYGTAMSSNISFHVVTMAEALNSTNLVWTTGGDVPWYVESSKSLDGYAVQCGVLTGLQQSWIKTKVIGPGKLDFLSSFQSSSTDNRLLLPTNGIRVINKTLLGGPPGSNWQSYTLYLGDGEQELEWRYIKGYSGNIGTEQGWLEQVSYTPGPTVPIITNKWPPDFLYNPDIYNETLGCFAIGTPPLSFQWLFNGSAIAGATSNYLTISNIQPSQAGSYVMVASNAYGTATSSVFSVTVTPKKPEIMRQPWSQSPLPSSNAFFMVSAKGTEPLTYQWRLNGVDLAGRTNSSLTLTNVQWSDVGAYSVVVSNQIGMATSYNAALTIQRFPPRFGVSGTNAGWSSNGFGMELRSLSGHGPVVIYGSTNLSDWVPLMTNPPVNWMLPFVDSSATNLPARFYRAEEQ